MKSNEEIKNAREVLRLSQEAFARIFDVSARTVIRWENGSSEPQSGVKKRVRQLLELLKNPDSAESIKETAGKSDGPELLRSLLSQGRSSNSSSFSGSLSSGTSSMGTSGLSPVIGAIVGLVGGTSNPWNAYQALRKHFESNSTSSGTSASTRYRCPICGCSEKGSLLHCTGALADGIPCTFVVCQKCIYSSKDAHEKLSPTCNRISVPAFETIDD